MKLREALKAEQVKYRQLYESAEALKKQVLETAKKEGGGNPELVQSRLEVAALRKRLEEAERERAQAIRDAVKQAREEERNPPGPDEKVRSVIEGPDITSTAEQMGKQIQVVANSFLAHVRGLNMSPEMINHIPKEYRLLLLGSLTQVISESDQAIIALKRQEEVECKAS